MHFIRPSSSQNTKISLMVLAILLFLHLSFSGFVSYQGKKPQNISGPEFNIDYRALQPGEVIKVYVRAAFPIKIARIRFIGKKYSMGKGNDPTKFLAFIGLDLGLKPGIYPMEITVSYENGSNNKLQKEVKIIKKDFPEKKLWVEEKFVTPPAEVQDRIKTETEILGTIYAIFTSHWLGKGKFIFPSEGDIVPNFGERRYFNNKPRSQHSGVDISTPFGYPVKASNSGRVVLVTDLYFAGNTVILDHGLGVFSLYCHFSKFHVLIGEFVEKGDIIGEIGATGRVTGPHLHWGMKIRGSRVDPLSFVELELE